MKTFAILGAVAFLLAGCAKNVEETPPVPKGKETVTANGPAKGSGGGSKGITEDQIELGPGLKQADNRAGSKSAGN